MRKFATRASNVRVIRNTKFNSEKVMIALRNNDCLAKEETPNNNIKLTKSQKMMKDNAEFKALLHVATQALKSRRSDNNGVQNKHEESSKLVDVKMQRELIGFSSQEQEFYYPCQKKQSRLAEIAMQRKLQREALEKLEKSVVVEDNLMVQREFEELIGFKGPSTLYYPF